MNLTHFLLNGVKQKLYTLSSPCSKFVRLWFPEDVDFKRKSNMIVVLIGC